MTLAADLATRATADIFADLRRVGNGAGHGVVVDSPPGAGKSTLVVRAAAELADAGEPIMVVAQTNEQVDDLAQRLATGRPDLAIGRLAAGDYVPGERVARHGNVTVSDKADDLKDHAVVIGTAHKWAITGPDAARSWAIVDEAYQMRADLMLRVARLFTSALCVGDPGQLDPFSTVPTERWTGLAWDPTQSAVSVLLRNNPDIPVRVLPVSWRLPASAAPIVSEAFYPFTGFRAATGPEDRTMGWSTRAFGVNVLDEVLETAVASGWALCELPAMHALRTDTEVAETCAAVAARLLERGAVTRSELGEHPVTASRVAIGTAHRDQAQAVRGVLADLGVIGVTVDTANRLQGREFDATVVWHPLSGRRDATAFHLESGRLCVLASRHRHACVVVTRAGIPELLDAHPSAEPMYLRVPAKFPDGWEANQSLMAHLSRYRVRLLTRHCQPIVAGGGVETFEEFFGRATGWGPHGYQARIAREGLPDVVRAATGTGKTGIILAWLWRRLHSDPEGTPRRLVYALPQRSLVEQVSGEAEKWLANLGLTDQVALHVVMGGRGESQRQWRLDMHRPAIVVGTVDSLVSKALNRGYGIGRAAYPIDFALVTNGAHWVIDEIQLCPESTTTLRQLAAFTRSLGTAEPFGLTCMSATVPEDLLETVDNPEHGTTIQILDSERIGELTFRLEASRALRQLHIDPGEYAEIAKVTRNRHRPGTLTLVVLNTVKAAREVYKRLGDGPAERVLLHSRFRGIERARLMKDVMEGAADRIVVATQVVEAGVDLDAAVLITEAAPWPSLVQRAGRCNRAGRTPDAELCWLPPKGAPPYEQPDIDATVAELRRLEGQRVTGEDLLASTVSYTREPVAVLRRSDFTGLFDTAPDLSGNDIDIAPYVRDAEDLDSQIAWATWTPEADDGRPPADGRTPAMEYRCRVPLGEVNKLTADVPVWRLDQVLGRWARVNASARARPGEVLVINAADGRYDPATGFDPSAKNPVPECPSMDATQEPPSGAEDSYAADSASVRQEEWLSLDRHSDDVRRQTERLLAVLAPRRLDGAAESAVSAAWLHDVGKAHPIWQNALCRLAPPDRAEEIKSGRPWAKSGDSGGRLAFAGNVRFRHELASLLLLDGPLRGLLDGVPDPDLARYLVLAHHGKLRLQVRDQVDAAVLDSVHEHTILGLTDGAVADIPGMLGQPATALTVDLGQFSLGGERSWTRTALGLRDRYGPFVLAYLEAVVRIADWRASAGLEEAE